MNTTTNRPHVCGRASCDDCPQQEVIKKHFTKKGCISGCAGCCDICLERLVCSYTCEAVRNSFSPAIQKAAAAPAPTIQTAAPRPLVEIEADIRANGRNALFAILNIGRDLTEAKAQLNHGQWLPWLENMGFASSTAENYMRLASEISVDSPLAALPYTKALALLAMPAETREQFAQDIDAENQSAAKIKQLVAAAKQEAEKRKQAEQALEKAQQEAEQAHVNLETAERGKNALLDQLDSMREKYAEQTQALNRQIDDLNEQLKCAEGEIREVEVVPGDYAQLKRDFAAMQQRCEEAEQYAADAEEALHSAQQTAQQAQMNRVDNQQDGDALTLSALSEACTSFLGDVYYLPFMGGALAGMTGADLDRYQTQVEGVLSWAKNALDALAKARGRRVTLPNDQDGGDYDVR